MIYIPLLVPNLVRLVGMVINQNCRSQKGNQRQRKHRELFLDSAELEDVESET